jgi:hypothetical protein
MQFSFQVFISLQKLIFSPIHSIPSPPLLPEFGNHPRFNGNSDEFASSRKRVEEK